MKRKTIFISVIVALFAASIVFLIVWNAINGNNSSSNKFLETSLSTCISLLLVLAVSFSLTQIMTGQRKKQEILIRVAQKLEDLIESPVGYRVCADSEDYEAILNSHKRQMSNLIKLLDNKADDFRIRDKVDYLKERFKEYDDLIGNHITDVEYLSNSEKELKRPLEVMTGTLFEIMLKLSD